MGEYGRVSRRRNMWRGEFEEAEVGQGRASEERVRTDYGGEGQ